MILTLNKAKELKKELDSYRPLDAVTEARIMQKFRLEWNYHSSNIEGNSLTYGETKALILHGITAQGKPLKDHLEITGHNEAVNWVFDIVKGEAEITENFIKQIHTLLLKERYQTDAQSPEGVPTKKWIEIGRYKETPNHVKTKTGEIFYFASPEETPSKMYDLINWYRENITKDDPIQTAIAFHYKFIRIHPFDDGNGRMARLLMNLILMKSGFPPVIIKTEDKANYLSALEQADAGEHESFITYISKNLINSLELMISGAKGESIEEEEDVFKELKLLEQEIETIAKTKSELVKSERVVKKFIEDTLIVLLEYLDDSLNDVIKQFEHYDYQVFFDNEDSEFNIVSVSGFREVISRIKEKDIEYDFSLGFSVFYSFSELSKIFDSFDVIEQILAVEFTYDCCVISIKSKSNKVWKFPYSKSHQKKDFDEIIQFTLKSLVSQMQGIVKSYKK